MKFAVMIPFGDSWVYVCEPDFKEEIRLFDTPDEAEVIRKTFGPNAFVVNYDGSIT